MATIRERVNADGSRKFHVRVRMSGFPARTASLPTRRQAERWTKTAEATLIGAGTSATSRARENAGWEPSHKAPAHNRAARAALGAA